MLSMYIWQDKSMGGRQEWWETKNNKKVEKRQNQLRRGKDHERTRYLKLQGVTLPVTFSPQPETLLNLIFHWVPLTERILWNSLNSHKGFIIWLCPNEIPLSNFKCFNVCSALMQRVLPEKPQVSKEVHNENHCINGVEGIRRKGFQPCHSRVVFLMGISIVKKNASGYSSCKLKVIDWYKCINKETNLNLIE